MPGWHSYVQQPLSFSASACSLCHRDSHLTCLLSRCPKRRPELYIQMSNAFGFQGIKRVYVAGLQEMSEVPMSVLTILVQKVPWCYGGEPWLLGGDFLIVWGGALGAPDASSALPLVHLLVPAPELHACALQHAPLPRHCLAGKRSCLVHSAPLACRAQYSFDRPLKSLHDGHFESPSWAYHPYLKAPHRKFSGC